MKSASPGRLVICIDILIIIIFIACKSEPPREDDFISRQQRELSTIDSLLKDERFSEAMAKALDSSYYAGVGQEVPAFLTAADDSPVFRSARNDKIAMKLAGFYALECGIGLLISQSDSTPVQWLQAITNKTIDSNAALLLTRFANATWKAGQPFKDLGRIKNANFTIASLLNEEEVGNDYFQINHSAEELLSTMDSVKNGSLQQQMEFLRKLLQDTAYALDIATHLHSSHDSIQPGRREAFQTTVDDTARVQKTGRQMKIATSIAGFYAMETALNYLVTTRKGMPSEILQSLVDKKLSDKDEMIFARFANATWKAGQPFRDLNRISRATFTPFYFLSEPDIEKDLVQVRAAARRMLQHLKE